MSVTVPASAKTQTPELVRFDPVSLYQLGPELVNGEHPHPHARTAPPGQPQVAAPAGPPEARSGGRAVPGEAARLCWRSRYTYAAGAAPTCQVEGRHDGTPEVTLACL